MIPELQMGGAARVVHDHARAFADFAQVREVVFGNPDGLGFAGDDVLGLHVGGGGGLITKAVNFWRRMIRLRRLKGDQQTQISVSHLEGAHYVDLLSRRGERNIVCVHGSILHNDEIRGIKGWIRKRLLIPLLYRRADVIVSVSSRLESELDTLGIPRRKIRTINNFFDIASIRASASETLTSGDARFFGDEVPVLLVVARLHQHKNLAVLIDVVAELARRRAVRLLILGDGPLRDDLVGHSRASGATTHDCWSQDGDPLSTICFAGARSNPFPFYAGATLFVLSSNIEGFPLSLCEAMSCNLPVVAADCPGGVREIVAPAITPNMPEITAPTTAPFGLLMPMLSCNAHSRNVWVEALDCLLRDSMEMKRLSEAAASRVSDFSQERIVPKWRALFDELLEERVAASKRFDRSTVDESV